MVRSAIIRRPAWRGWKTTNLWVTISGGIGRKAPSVVAPRVVGTRGAFTHRKRRMDPTISRVMVNGQNKMTVHRGSARLADSSSHVVSGYGSPAERWIG